MDVCGTVEKFFPPLPYYQTTPNIERDWAGIRQESSYTPQPKNIPSLTNTNNCTQGPGCGVNLIYKTMPDHGVNKKITVRGPTSIKSLYSSVPNYYPPLLIEKPVNSMYGL